MALDRLARIVLLVALLGSLLLTTGGSVLAECSQLDPWPSPTG